MKKILIILFAFTLQTTIAQDISIRTSAGFAGYGTPFDGVYFSFDVGFPIIDGVEIAPTFTFASNFENHKVKYYWNDINPKQYIINDNKNSGGKLSGLFELYLVLNPFKLFPKKQISKTDFGMGFGYGLSYYSHNYYNYNSPNGNHDFVGIMSETGIRKSASVKLFYNYHFKKYFIGINLGAIDLIHGEGQSLLGLQFGARL